jgi:hypothetical protein
VLWCVYVCVRLCLWMCLCISVSPVSHYTRQPQPPLHILRVHYCYMSQLMRNMCRHSMSGLSITLRQTCFCHLCGWYSLVVGLHKALWVVRHVSLCVIPISHFSHSASQPQPETTRQPQPFSHMQPQPLQHMDRMEELRTGWGGLVF